MPPGDNKIIMSYENIEDKETYNLLEGIVPLRKEEVKFQELNFVYSLYFMKKRTKKRLLVRQFQKHKSVFRDWVPDTKQILKLSLDFDIKNSKIRKFISDPDQYGEVYSLLLDNLPKLKEIFTHCIGISSYPYISWLEF